ncbi:MAG: glycosyltransferase [Bacteroidales bacterium]|nr:glycosyltransferase [Bacteroidales bacterium]
MKVVIVGATSQTAGIGGVTMHVERLLEALQQSGEKVEYVDYKESAIRPFICCFYSDVVHIHTQNKLYSYLVTIWAKIFHTKVVYTLHQKYDMGSSLSCRLCNRMLMICDAVITLNTQSRDDIKARLGIDTLLLPAFIPPTHTEPLNDEIMAIICKAKDSGKRLCVTNAAFHAIGANGETYGISFLVKYFMKHPDSFLLISDPSGQNKAAVECDVPNIAFITYRHSFYEVLKYADVFIRHTNTDGDSLSVKESLSLGVPTLCTDIVDRPEDAILFKYNEETSFQLAMQTATKRERSFKTFETPVDRIIKLYNQLGSL